MRQNRVQIYSERVKKILESRYSANDYFNLTLISFPTSLEIMTKNKKKIFSRNLDMMRQSQILIQNQHYQITEE